MEDRNTAGLYFEMTNLDPDDYLRQRLPALLALEHVERVTWWRDCMPGRRDYPRTLPDASLLVVYEVGDRFGPPSAPSEINAIHLRRYRRPGQGVLTGNKTTGLEFVLISPTSEDQAQALRDWADFIHIRYIAAAQPYGFTMITPYENVLGPGSVPRFCHFYEMDGNEDPESIFRGMTPAVKARFGGPGTDFFNEWMIHPALQIDYVTTYALIGEATP